MLARAEWHFVTGLGNAHPVENGLAWHHTLGVPFLTGAAVKGLLRAWCEAWVDGFDEGRLRAWFGPSQQELEAGAERATGGLIFFDALPVRPVRLKADIMTPHYGQWYAEGASRPNKPDTTPADWHDPLPVKFLVVDRGAEFRFAIARRPGAPDEADPAAAMDALKEALQHMGAGAKTAAGYGRMQAMGNEDGSGLENVASEADLAELKRIGIGGKAGRD